MITQTPTDPRGFTWIENSKTGKMDLVLALIPLKTDNLFKGDDGRHYNSKEELREADRVWLGNYRTINLNPAVPVRWDREVVYEPSDTFPPTYYIIFF